MRLAFAAVAHVDKAVIGAVAHRQHVVGPDEDIDLADLNSSPSISMVLSTQNNSSPYSSILGRWLVLRASSTARSCRPNSCSHHGQFAGAGVLERDPDEAVRARQVVADRLDRDVGELSSILIGDAVDQHADLLGTGRSVAKPPAGRQLSSPARYRAGVRPGPGA